jgi:hypothetical protein
MAPSAGASRRSFGLFYKKKGGNFNLFNQEPARLKIVRIIFFQKPETLKRLSISFFSFIDNEIL